MLFIKSNYENLHGLLYICPLKFEIVNAPSPVYQQLLEIDIMNVFILLMISSFYLSHL